MSESVTLRYSDGALRLDDDGTILCPDATCDGDVKEQDVAVRWNRLVLRDGIVTAATGDADFEQDKGQPYLCDRCMCTVEMPNGFEISDWY